ncbi:MAG: SDR family NAD(P)-dependent oxidoreductase [Deltaproteobacteria bacterium]
MRFDSKKVLITGASRGIGRAAAIAFAGSGAIVGINYLSDDKNAMETLSRLQGEGHKLFKEDISTAEGAERLIENFLREYGSIDILINNAGIVQKHEIDKTDFEDWQKSWNSIINTNLISVANLCYFAVRHMIRNGGGRIVNVSSRGAFRGEPDMPAYGASKAALNSLSQSLAKKLAKYKIYVSVVAPGFVETDMGINNISEAEKTALMNENPFQRMATAKEVAHSILFLASEGSEYNTGAILDINGASYLRS